MHFNWTFTGDGFLALAAGALAFLAVQRQIRAEKKASREEHEERKRAVATGILFEIDFLCSAVTREIATESDHLLPSGLLPTRFAVYEANAADLGNLGQDTVALVVKFYGILASYLNASKRYVEEMDRAKLAARSASLGDERLTRVASLSLAYKSERREAIPEIERAAKVACELLCKRCQVNPATVSTLARGSGATVPANPSRPT